MPECGIVWTVNKESQLLLSRGSHVWAKPTKLDRGSQNWAESAKLGNSWQFDSTKKKTCENGVWRHLDAQQRGTMCLRTLVQGATNYMHVAGLC